MRIALLGSWCDGPKWVGRGEQDDFRAACLKIGRELARHQQAIIVCGESLRTADHSVVAGFIESLSSNSLDKPLVEVIQPEDEYNLLYQKEAREHPQLFAFHSQAQRRGLEAHLMAIRDADSVLTIGGKGGTYQAGLAAIVAKKKLVPIASFGGASTRLLQALEGLASRSTLSELRTLNGPWSDHVCQVALRLLGVGRLPRLLIVHGHSDDRHKLELWLRKQGGLSEVFVMQQEFGAGRSLPEKFEDLASGVDGAIVIATPDDLGGVKGDGIEQPRARQNVWLEVGWFWGRLGRDRILVLCKGDLEIPSDLQGVEHYRYSVNPEEVGESIRAFINWLQGSA